MTKEMKTAITRLKGLPENAQDKLAPHLNEYLNKLEDLRDTLQSSYESGKSYEFDVEEIKRKGRKRLKAKD